MFGDIYKNKKVLVTGHTGFKGSWLAEWLCTLGAEVIGYALEPGTTPSFFKASGLESKMTSVIGDIRDPKALEDVFKRHKPEVVFHMAAQSLVRPSYRQPRETLETNILGTFNVFEACRNTPSVRAIVNITSDKCYENKENEQAYCEDDPLGGYDPYSASKACAEVITASFRCSFFPLEKYGKDHRVLLASVRAGNVVGGGDWAEDRLVPDIMRATSKKESVTIRHPNAIRSWQHVLEPLSGYLMLGQKLIEGNSEFADAWNFGLGERGNLKVQDLVGQLQKYWEEMEYRISDEEESLHEASQLRLDNSKACSKLGWQPIWDISQALEKTGEWYRCFYKSQECISSKQIAQYIQAAKQKNIEWAV